MIVNSLIVVWFTLFPIELKILRVLSSAVNFLTQSACTSFQFSPYFLSGFWITIAFYSLVGHIIQYILAEETIISPSSVKLCLTYHVPLEMSLKHFGCSPSEASTQGKLLRYLVSTNFSYFSCTKNFVYLKRKNWFSSNWIKSFSHAGGHSIGRISCEFILPRLNKNFLGKGSADPTLPSDFLEEIRLKCQESNSSFSNSESFMRPSDVIESDMSMAYFQEELSSSSSTSAFGTHYYQSLMRGRGLLFADQQLTAHEETAKIVVEYALDDGTAFQRDFARAMVKMSNLVSLTGSQGQVRLNCSIALMSSWFNLSWYPF